MRMPEKLIPEHGQYRHLTSSQVAELAYDVTVQFWDRYIEKRSRTPAALDDAQMAKLWSGEWRVKSS